MKPIGFKEQNTVFARDQKEYLPLPAYKASDGKVMTCWRPSLKERFQILFTGKIWLSILTYNRPLQPLLLLVKYPFKKK
jgi:hypothetical protein